MFEPNIAGQGSEQRNSLSNQHRNPSNDQALNESGAQEFLNRNSAVNVDVAEEARRELRNNPGVQTFARQHLL